MESQACCSRQGIGSAYRVPQAKNVRPVRLGAEVIIDDAPALSALAEFFEVVSCHYIVCHFVVHVVIG